jgi:hypothetical protein
MIIFYFHDGVRRSLYGHIVLFARHDRLSGRTHQGVAVGANPDISPFLNHMFPNCVRDLPCTVLAHDKIVSLEPDMTPLA